MPGPEPASFLRDTHPEVYLEAVRVASELPLSMLGTYSNRAVQWRCNACHHEWGAKVAARACGGGCPKCAQSKRARSLAQAPDGASLQDLYPAVAAEFISNLTRPDMTPSDLRPRARQRCVWKCSRCGHRWEATVANRADGRGCMACANQRRAEARRRPTAKTGTAAERATFPQSELVVNLTHAERGLADLKPASKDRCLWRCSECSHEWEATVVSRVVMRSGCPVCGTRRAATSWATASLDQSLLALYPNIASEFVSNENSPGRSSAQIKPGSNALCRWRCNRGHEWITTVASRVAGTGCARCGARGQSRLELEVAELLRATTGEHVEVDVRVQGGARTWRLDISIPALMLYIDLDPAFWHSDTARDQRKVDALPDLHYVRVRDEALPALARATIVTVAPRSLNALEWAAALRPVIIAVGGSWTEPTTETTARALGSAAALWRQTLQGRPMRSAADVAPQLKDELLRNETRPGVELDWLPPSAKDKCWWKCRDCGHEWRTSVEVRAYLGSGCPECGITKAARRRSTAPPGGSLADLHPEITTEFSSCSRPDRSPADLRPSSNLMCFWRCSNCGHGYKASPASRTRGQSCPQCAKAKAGDARSRGDAARGSSLAGRSPRLSEEFVKLIGRPHRSPADIPVGSNLKAMWRCGKCKHEWTTTVVSRALGGTGCPPCGRLRTAHARSAPAAGRSLLDLFPDIAEQFVENLTHLGRGPAHLKAGSHDRCRWRCDSGHEWQTTAKNRTRGGTGCPRCQRQS
ncbi:zinc-ribbon domain-containing protein [Myceligenerans xiligouense]|uniref:Putative zinc ribbon protein n=1 Tax=Myceligenerans xiligouense TaxID=253184 RepID=A0A3N4ZMC0_9MICO|nr:putative zinc ribbon protein [Myceligenerans xiligouense]